MKRLICLLLVSTAAFSAGEGNQTVQVAGQPVQLTTTVSIATICSITAFTGNQGVIWLGFDSNVSAANKKGTPLAPGATYLCGYAGPSFWHMEGFWSDATNSTDGYSYSYK